LSPQIGSVKALESKWQSQVPLPWHEDSQIALQVLHFLGFMKAWPSDGSNVYPVDAEEWARWKVRAEEYQKEWRELYFSAVDFALDVWRRGLPDRSDPIFTSITRDEYEQNSFRLEDSDEDLILYLKAKNATKDDPKKLKRVASRLGAGSITPLAGLLAVLNYWTP